jgi:hypothetical protein
MFMRLHLVREGARVNSMSIANLLEHAAARLQCADFGMRLANLSPLLRLRRALGVIAELLSLVLGLAARAALTSRPQAIISLQVNSRGLTSRRCWSQGGISGQ